VCVCVCVWPGLFIERGGGRGGTWKRASGWEKCEMPPIPSGQWPFWRSVLSLRGPPSAPAREGRPSTARSRRPRRRPSTTRLAGRAARTCHDRPAECVSFVFSRLGAQAEATHSTGRRPRSNASLLSPSCHSLALTADAARANELVRSFVLEGLLYKGRGGTGVESYAECVLFSFFLVQALCCFFRREQRSREARLG